MKKKKKSKGNNEAVIQGGTAAGIHQAAEKSIAEAKFHGARGHGWAAERGNDLQDRLTGKHAKIVGDNNVKGGPDRVVDGVFIQSKYCASPNASIKACFKNDEFSYYADGSPMQIEVPSDQYDEAVKLMADRIQKGMINGVTDPAEAGNIVRKGHYTYIQAKNMARMGTVESLKYDAETGAITAGCIGSVSFVLSLAAGIQRGKSFEAALDDAIYDGSQVAGYSFVVNIVAGQLSKAGFNQFVVSHSDRVAGFLGSKTCNTVANAFRTGNTQLYGQASRNGVAKLIGNGAVGVAAVTATQGVAGGVDLLRGRISGRQYCENTISSGVGAAGGFAGGTVGKILGDMVLPGVGGKIGTVVGGFAAGTLSSTAVKKVFGLFGKDDETMMREIIWDTLNVLAEEYLLTQEDVDAVAEAVNPTLSKRKLKKMFASKDREQFARDLMVPVVEERLKRKEHVSMPDEETLMERFKKLFWGEEEPEADPV